MNRRLRSVMCLVLAPCLASVAVGAPEVETLLKMMPADFPFGAVIVNFDKFDKNVITYVKTIDPKSDFEGMLADMKKDIGIGPWIDFTKPLGFAQAGIQDGEPILWATIPGFKDKVKTVPDAKEEEGGVWFLPFAEKEDMYAAAKGDYVIAARDKTMLESAMKTAGRTLADDLRPRLDLLANRDVYIHLNFDPIRPMAAGGIAQAAQMAPMFAMMAAQQGGGDPASMTAVLNGIVDALKKFVEQVAYLDITIGINGATASATIASGFKEGEIKNYLAKTKPAATPILSTIEEQPFTVAMGWNIPNEDSPFLTYLFDKMAAPAGGAPGGEGSASAEGANLARELYKKVEGMNMVMNAGKDGMTSAGDYIGKDAAGIFDLAKKSMVKESPLAAMMSSGMSYEAAPAKKIGDKNVETFTIKTESNQAGQQTAQLLGSNTTLYMAPMEGRVGYYVGPEPGAQKFFSGKVQKPLPSSPLVADALKELPQKRNLVVLIDPIGFLPMIGPMVGMPVPENLSPGPPVALSATLSGEFARTDVHVPAKAIAKVMEVMSPQPPM